MSHTPVLQPCSACGSQAVAYLAPCGVGYLVHCGNADCTSRHCARGIVSGTGVQVVASRWNRQQGAAVVEGV